MIDVIKGLLFANDAHDCENVFFFILAGTVYTHT